MTRMMPWMWPFTCRAWGWIAEHCSCSVKLACANPFRPEPYALGLASAKRLEDVDGIKWATLGILGQGLAGGPECD